MPLTPPFTDAQNTALALIPKFTASLSFFGSAYIIQDSLRSRKKRQKVYHRLMIGLSAFDLVASTVNFLSTWPSPVGTPGAIWASGTTQTCTAQGWFNEMGNIATPLYTAMLCWYYILVIHWGWKEDRVRPYEKVMHSLPVLAGLTMSIIGTSLDAFNNASWLCWFAELPPSCRDDPLVECERGYYASVLQETHYAILWTAIVFVTIAMVLIYKGVREKETASSRYEFRPASPSLSGNRDRPTRQNSRKVATQAFLFVFAMYLTWFFTSLSRIIVLCGGTYYYPLVVLEAIMFPFQGFFNVIIYLRPRYIRAKKRPLNRNRHSFAVARQIVMQKTEQADFHDLSVMEDAGNDTEQIPTPGVATGNDGEERG